MNGDDERATIPLDVSDFVMAPETLIEKHGGMCALVYGRVWRYAQQKKGVCTASHKTIADALHVSRQTVQKYVALLVSEGYLEEVPYEDAVFSTKHYVTTSHLGFSGSITTTGGGIPVKKVDRIVKKVDRSLSKKQTDPVKKVDTKKELKKDSKERVTDSRSNDRGKIKKKRDPLLDHLAIVEYRDEAHLHVPISWRAQVAETVGNDPEEVRRWRAVVHDWIGRGWKKTNVKGMLEVFRKPEREEADPYREVSA